MELQEAIEILKKHNRWRRGAEIQQQNPFIIGEAIDTVVTHYETENYLKMVLSSKKHNKITKKCTNESDSEI